MSFGSCSKCWDDPCTCGHEYVDRNQSNEHKIKIIAEILGVSEDHYLLDDIKKFLEVTRS
jgi:hypothetical protein